MQAIRQSFGMQLPLYGYGLAAMTVVIAVLATYTLPVIGEQAGFLLFFFAIIQAAFWLGIKPAIFALILSLLALNTLAFFRPAAGFTTC
jgi:K+-sensing histidine kinase KdpD